MSVSMSSARAVLDPDEPDYDNARQLGEDALPHLAALVRTDDSMLASKAVNLAALIGSRTATDVVAEAARSSDPVLRVAAAGAARHLPAEAASEIILTLVDDVDPGVQRIALTSAPASPSTTLLERLQELSDSGPAPHVRDLAARVVARTKPRA
jgi:HEAT repeat protein